MRPYKTAQLLLGSLLILGLFSPLTLRAVDPLDTEIQVYYPVASDGRTLARILVPSLPGGAREVFLNGQVLQEGEVLQTFRYRFTSLPFVFERPLSPGRYTLRLELEEPSLEKVLVGERLLIVPEAGKAGRTLLASYR